jgi:hypothetical protein
MLLVGAALGLLLAAQVGPVTLLIVRAVLESGAVAVALGIVSAAILIAIGARTLWRGVRARGGIETDGYRTLRHTDG